MAGLWRNLNKISEIAFKLTLIRDTHPPDMTRRIFEQKNYSTVYLTYIYIYSIFYLAFFLKYILTFYLRYILTLYLAIYLTFHPPVSLTFYVAYIPAFYLTYILAVYLAFYVAFYNGILCGILSHSFWQPI